MSEAPDSSRLPSVAQERYQVLFPLGRGGMGAVDVALEKVGSFRRIVALKTMLTESSRDRRQIEMFLREARLARMLNHPNVVHAFAAGEENGQLYISMEYVEGAPLNLLLARARELEGGLSPALSAHLLAEICDGLHAAHELCDEEGKSLGVVHRDVSPHNVMVAYQGHVKVLDFGVAKIDESKLTHTGEVKGKTAYMAPEQALGEALDRRSDLFAIGAMLYECVTGTRMWGSGSDVEVMRKLALNQAPRLADVMPGAPPALAQLQERLVARDANARPRTAREVSQALRAYLSTCGDAVDDRALGATMMRLFSAEAAQRRHTLARALEGVVDRAGADALKKSLSTGAAPLSDSERRMIARLHPGSPPVAAAKADEAARARSELETIPHTVAATQLDMEAPDVVPRRRSSLPAVAAIATIATVAVIGAAAFLKLGGTSSTANPPLTATTTTPPSAVPTSADAAVAPVASFASGASSVSTSTVDAGSAVAASALSSTSTRPRAVPRPHAPSTAASTTNAAPAPGPPSATVSSRPEIDTHAM